MESIINSKLLNNSIPVVYTDSNIYVFYPNQGKIVKLASNQERYIDILPIDTENEPEKPEDKNYIQGFIFVTTTRCNMNCEYCYSIGKSKLQEISGQGLIQIFKKHVKQETKVIYIGFTGGEPTLNMKAIKEFISYLKTWEADKTIYLRINTNGKISERSLDFLIENNFKIIVSNDGPSEISSMHRIKYDGDIIENNIKKLVKSNIDFRLRATITKQNLKSLVKNIYYWKSLGVKFVDIKPFNPYDINSSQLSMIPGIDEFVEYFNMAIETASKEGIWISTGIYSNLLTPSTYFCTTNSGMYRSFNPDGSISSCYRVQNSEHELNNFIIGDWKKNIYDIKWLKKEKLLRSISVEKNDECKRCPAKYACSGGCPMRNYLSTGSFFKVDSWQCKVNKKLFESAILLTDWAIRNDYIPAIFGQIMFEKSVLEKPFKGRGIVNYQSEFIKNTKIYELPLIGEVIDIKKALGLTSTNYVQLYKFSRAECI